MSEYECRYFFEEDGKFRIYDPDTMEQVTTLIPDKIYYCYFP